MKSVRFLALFLVGLMLMAAGCGSGSTSEPASRPDAQKSAGNFPAAAKETLKVSLGVGGKASIIYLPPAIAEYNGYFKDEALDITVTDLSGGAQVAQALVSGQIDFASMAFEHTVKSKAQGVDLVMLVLYTRYPAITLVVDSKLQGKVKSINDLKGMRVGVTSPGSATHKAMLSLMEMHGMKASDVEIIGVGTSGMPAAIESGKVHAAFGLDPWVTQMTSSGKAFTLWDLRTKKDTEALYKGEYPFVGLVTRREMIEKNPELVERVVRAVVNGNKFLAASSAETITAKLPAEMKGADEALYLASLRSNMEAFSPDGLASERGLQLVIDSLKADKVIPDNLDVRPDMVFDSSWARKAK